MVFKLDPEDTILFIIDLQEKLMKVMEYREKVYKNTNLLLEAAKQFSIPVIVSEQYPKGMGATAKDIAQNFPEVYHYLEKTSFSAYKETLQEILQKIGHKTIIITGSETHVCVFQTTRDLIDAGYNVQLVSDAVCSRTKQNYKNGLDLMKSLGAVITNTETVVFDLLQYSDIPQFKVLSPLLK